MSDPQETNLAPIETFVPDPAQVDALYSALQTADPDRAGVEISTVRGMLPRMTVGRYTRIVDALVESGRATSANKPAPNGKTTWRYIVWSPE